MSAQRSVLMTAGVLLISGMGMAVPATAQVTPTTPRRFAVKPVGSSTEVTGATIRPSQPPETRKITYLTLSPPRQWTSADGRSVIGKLIAWEQTVVTSAPTPATTAAAGAEKKPAPATPTPGSPPSTPATAAALPGGPAPAGAENPVPSGAAPTVVRDGKIRLLVGSVAHELPLEKLSEVDRKVVEEIRSKAAPAR